MLEQVTDTAKELILFKAETATIAYAKEIAQYFDIYNPILEKDFGFWASVLHFEMRYQSLNFFIENDTPKNIVELSSGFSLRGLFYTEKQRDFKYWDTDLKSIIEIKKQMIKSWDIDLSRNLVYEELDVLNSDTFPEVNGEVLVINEGLLMYFDKDRKKKILQNIYDFLKKNGGAWVTSDIYIKHETNVLGSDKNKKWSNFFKKQNIQNHYFESFEGAERFFNDNGFEIVAKYEPEFARMSSLPKLLQCASDEQLAKMKAKGKIQETWKLKIK